MRNPFCTASLCVVGNLNRDVKLHDVPGSPALLRDGETSVSGISETIGGGGANSACAAAALGARVHFIGKVGADALGDQLRRTMERHGVRTTLARSKDSPTGTSVALGLASGHRHFLSCLPNNESLRLEDLDLTSLRSSRHLLRADVWFSKQMLMEGNQRLLSQAQQRGLMTSLDINFDPVWSSGSQPEIRRRKRLLRNILPLVDMAHGNVRELKDFTDSPDLSTALTRLSKWGVKSVVAHLGKDGAGFYRNSKLIVEPANKARRTVHSTGTGDVLSICMILLAANDQLSISQKLRLANRTVREFMEGRRQLIPQL
jgi:sugar/nucleoside kinase (ribokinase family)